MGENRADRVSATGHSSTRLSIQEAFEDAVRQLDTSASFPDAMVEVEVLRIGAEIGGITGREVAVVNVQRVPKSA